MRLFLIILFIILIAPLTALAQQGNDWLRAKLKNADTVLVVSHEMTIGLVDSAGNDIPLPQLLVSGKPNYAIIRERQQLAGAQLDTFIKIFVRPFQDRQIVTARCFVPYHAVFIIKNGTTSWIDICFGCRHFNTSKDLEELYAFDNRKWTELENFLMRIGFKYELEEQ